MIEIKLTVSDIPKEKIFNGAKGKYLDVVCAEMQKADQYGFTHTVYVKQTKEERAAKAPKVYIGKGKLVVFNEQPKQTYTPPVNTPEPEPFDAVANEEESDLPF